AYSRVNETAGKPLENANLDAVLASALLNLEFTLEEASAVVTQDPLPTLFCDDVQIGQVFQNLIGNAIKYRSAEAPAIHISSVRRGEEWIISVRDNGIGIDPKYHERIFGIFKRLHGRELPGTGMGLAICRRIVERHKGRIWVESEAGRGAVFHFAVPA
ncbi:MAG: cyanobacterial phytochrome A, partial [Bryobacteraceae bacterium]|nr:cyanobacterial phytochrome A [Bryobacteraceae bacterium]